MTQNNAIKAMPSATFGDERDWFFAKRFGLFIHWGLYAINGFHEQEMYRKRIPRTEYETLVDRFNPTRFDPDAWLDLAEATGMEYLTFTAKHIDGFCMWDTAFSDFKVTNTPYGKDVLDELAQACRRRGFPLCLYYSLVDNHHVNYPNQNRPHELVGPEPGDAPSETLYLNYVKNQIRELCSSYGTIHGIWWDGSNFEHKDDELNAMIRELQPGAVINDRGMSEGDFSTLERDYSAELKNARLAFDAPTEGCQSVGLESWGYRSNENYYSPLYLKGHIQEYLAKGANYLLNVGPMADGAFPEQAIGILQDIGRWYSVVKESLVAATPCSEITGNRDILLTRKDNVLYVHCTKAPICDAIPMKPINRLPVTATLLNTGMAVASTLDYFPKSFPDRNAYLRLVNLPLADFNEPWVIKLEFDADVGVGKAAASAEIG